MNKYVNFHYVYMLRLTWKCAWSVRSGSSSHSTTPLVPTCVLCTKCFSTLSLKWFFPHHTVSCCNLKRRLRNDLNPFYWKHHCRAICHSQLSPIPVVGKTAMSAQGQTHHCYIMSLPVKIYCADLQRICYRVICASYCLKQLMQSSWTFNHQFVVFLQWLVLFNFLYQHGFPHLITDNSISGWKHGHTMVWTFTVSWIV